MKKYLVVIIAIILLPFVVKAADPEFKISCPTGGTINSTLKCNLKVKADTAITEVSLNYDFGSNFNYVSFTTDSNFQALSATAEGFDIKNENGATGEFVIGVLSFKFLNTGILGLKNIKIVDATPSVYTASKIEQPIKVLSEDNTLKSLSISSGTLTPAFQSNVLSYRANVNAATVTINAITNDPNAKVKNETKLNLDYGENIIKIVVTSESGSTKTYEIVIVRSGSAVLDNRIKSVTLSAGSINFSPANINYVISVNEDVEKVNIMAELENSKASFVNGFGPREVTLTALKNVFELKVRGSSGEVKTYTFTFIKGENLLSSNNNIKELIIEGYDFQFDPTILEYDINQKEGILLNFKIALADPTARYELENADLRNGNTVIIKVIAENGDIREYKFNIIHEKSTTVDGNKTTTTSFFSDFICNENSIIYYLIFFVLGLIVATLISIIVYKRKISRMKKEYHEQINKNYRPVSENTEILFYDNQIPNQPYNSNEYNNRK